MNFADEFMPSAKTVCPRSTVRTEVNGTERNGTERTGPERLKREEKRNGNGAFFLTPTVFLYNYSETDFLCIDSSQNYNYNMCELHVHIRVMYTYIESSQK